MNVLSMVPMKQPATRTSLFVGYRTQAGYPLPMCDALRQNGPAPGKPIGKSAKVLLQFRGDESVRDGLARISGELIERALARIDSAGAHRSEDVHQVRVTLKRLRALLRLVRPVVSESFCDRENRRLKDLADRLAFFRDTTVSRQTLATLARRGADRSARAFDLVLARFAEQAPEPGRFRVGRERALNHAAKCLAAAKQSFENMLIPAEDWQALGPGLQQVYSRARNCMLRALTYQTPEAFHEWRKQVKYLYYQLRLLESISPRRLNMTLRRLRRLEDSLGEDHDLAVLEKLLCDGRQEYGGKRAVKRVVACLIHQSKKLKRESAALGKELFREKPRKFADRLGRHWSLWRMSDR